MLNPSHAAEANATHYHFSILASFVMVYFLHVWLQVNSIARARSDVPSGWFVVEQKGPQLSTRFFVSLIIFLMMCANPVTGPIILGYMGVTLSENVIALMTLPMNVPIAGGMGVFIDSLLAYFPMLKNALPPIEFSNAANLTET